LHLDTIIYEKEVPILEMTVKDENRTLFYKVLHATKGKEMIEKMKSNLETKVNFVLIL